MPAIPKEEITPELLDQLYAKHNLQPQPHNVMPDNFKKCCGMGALLVEAGCVETGGAAWEDAADKLYGEDFTLAFELGFDAGIRNLSALQGASEPFMLGHRCGQRFMPRFIRAWKKS